MPMDISFHLTDEDLEHFRALAEQAHAALESGTDQPAIVGGCRELLRTAANQAALPGFIGERLQILATLVDMVEDGEWQLEDEDRARVLSAMAYFADPEDTIPDRVPGIGFLDDAIMIELIGDSLRDEIDSYGEFCRFRSAVELRRAARGEETAVSRADWLADQRARLYARMRRRRAQRVSSGAWVAKLW